MGLFKTNKVKCDIGSYIHYWRGVKKSGKTTLFYNLVQEQYGSLDKGLLISIGDEIGYQALDGLVFAEAPTWSDLIEIIDELVENKSDNDFEVVALDTADEMIKIAKEEVKRLHKKQKGVAAEFNACLGGYGAPRDKVVELVDEQLARLRKSGYGIIIIGHTKIRDITQKNGEAYQQLTSNLSSDYDGIFSNKADIVMTIAIERDIDENKHINGVDRYMYFRSDGFVDAGGRFANMPERIEYGAKNYIECFEAGVKGAIIGGASDKEIKSRKDEERTTRIKKAEAFAEEEKTKDVSNELEAQRTEFLAVIQANFSNASDEVKDAAKSLLAEAGVKKFSDTNLDIYVLKEISELFN